MALIFCDSFDNYNSTAIAALGKWQTVVDTATMLSVSAGSGRNGTAALKVNSSLSGSVPGYLQGVTASSLPSIVIGFAFQVGTFDPAVEIPFLQFLDASTPQITVSYLPNGSIRFRSGKANGSILSTSSASVITSTGTYFYLEFLIVFNTSTGALTLHSNGSNVTLSASSGLNTAPSGNNQFSTYQIGVTDAAASIGANIAVHFFDDLYIVSTSGGTNTGFLGDVRVACVFPNGAGNFTQFTPNGAATNWQCVSETSEDGDTTYVASATVGQKDAYTKQATPATTGPIFGIQVCSVARKDDSGGRSISNVVISGATESDQSAVALTTSYAWYLNILENDPNTSAPWTKTNFDAAQIGVKVAA